MYFLILLNCCENIVKFSIMPLYPIKCINKALYNCFSSLCSGLDQLEESKVKQQK